MITAENFGENNRERKIGNSIYRICRNDENKWYIHEIYATPDGKDWATANHFYTDDLNEVINTLNSFTKEREIISKVIA